jgi:para-nitrobenzyl esterase
MGPRQPDWDEAGCLNLNVWTPDAAFAEDGEPRPVLLWFHGGAFGSGSGGWDWYDGRRLAAAGDIVVVTANYRLGPLGYLWLPEIGADNLGSCDQAAALEWVRSNIGAFGGDPGVITVGGQSAGAYSALALALDPTTSGLVSRLILQSGPWGMPALQPGDAAEITAAYLRLLGISEKDKLDESLRSVRVNDLLGAHGRLAAERAKPGGVTPLMYPVTGGFGLPADWRGPARSDGLAGKQVLIGSTSDEMTAFLPRHAVGDYLDERVTRASDEIFGAGVTEIARYCAAAGSPAFAYRFGRHSPADTGLGAPHCAELPFLFGTFAAFGDAPMLGPVTEADHALSREFATALATFTATGSPGGSWPAYEPENGRHVRRFG